MSDAKCTTRRFLFMGTNMSEMHTARAGRNEDLSGIRRTPSNTIFALKFFAWGLMMGVGFWGSVTMPLPYILPFQILCFLDINLAPSIQ